MEPHEPRELLQHGGRRQLPPGGTPVERLSMQTKGLAEDVKDWVELRIRLVQTEVEEKIQQKVHQVVMRMIPLVLGGLAGLFLLVTIALAPGSWLGAYAWGFLIVTAVLGIVAGILMYRNRHMMADPRMHHEVDKERTQAS